jgi:hypothetical protein
LAANNKSAAQRRDSDFKILKNFKLQINLLTIKILLDGAYFAIDWQI